MSIPQQYHSGLGWGEQPLGPAVVEDFAGAAEQHRDDPRVAGDPPGGLGAEQAAVVEAAQGGGRADAVLQVGQAHRHHQGGLGPARAEAGQRRGEGLRVDRVLIQPLPRPAWVVAHPPAGSRLGRGVHPRARGGSRVTGVVGRGRPARVAGARRRP